MEMRCREALHGLTMKKWDIAFSIYVSCDLNMKVALDYCLMNGADNAGTCQEVLECRYLAESVSTINDIQDAGHDWRGTRATMQAWLVEYSLNKWIQRSFGKYDQFTKKIKQTKYKAWNKYNL